MVRYCDENDYLALREFRIKAIKSDPESFTASVSDYEKAPLAYWRNISAISGEGRTRRIFVVDLGDFKAMAAIGITDHALTAQFTSLWVDPLLRGQGHASDLFKACKNWAIANNHDRIRLQVKADNKAAIKAYKAWGFEIRERRQILTMELLDINNC